MTTFQAVIYAIVQGFSEFLPVSSNAHRMLLPYLLGWPEPNAALIAALVSGSFLSVLIYFRHDWASMLSCFLQVVIYRRRPMTLDERLPLFIIAATLPFAAAWKYLTPTLANLNWTPLAIAGSLAAFCAPLAFTDNFSRKNKAIYDWNWLDAITVGILQIAGLIPGCGRITGALIGGLFRNYNREASAKFALYVSAPVLGASAFMQLRSLEWGTGAPGPELSWLSFGVAVVVTMLVGLLAIGGMMKSLQRNGFGRYFAYRILVAVAVAGLFWFRRE